MRQSAKGRAPSDEDDAYRMALHANSDHVDSALMMTAKVIRRAYDEALAARLSMTLHEANILSELADAGSLTQIDLARRVGVSRARVGVHVESLAARDAVKRAADPADRRVWKVSLTRGGRSLWKQSVAVSGAVRMNVHAGLTDTDLDVLDRLLLSIQENLDGHAG
jgi:MarR family transcriptional regulator for hemolysin